MGAPEVAGVRSKVGVGAWGGYYPCYQSYLGIISDI